MKHCVLCDRNYPDEVIVCEVDGSTLRASSRREDTLIGKVINRRYRVLERLGEGGMSIVYVAEQINVERKVALKIMHAQYSSDEEFVRRFRQEAKLAASLSHPNIVQVYDFDQAEDGTLFLAMEYLRGINLRDLIQQRPLGLARAVRLAVQIAEGLASAHRAGVIHRDIKPENIMVLPHDPEIRLLDFGIARLGDVGSNTRLTRAGMMMGTPSYMAPEQIEGGEVTERTDIYALGIVLYEMLCGVAPFRAPTPAAILIKHLKEVATPPRKLRGDIPVAVERVVTQAMEKKPELRQKSVQEIAAALRSAQAKLPLESSQPTLAATQAIDLTDIETERGLRATKKSWLRSFVPWRSGGGGEPRTADAADRPPDNTAAVDLGDVAPTLAGETTIAETMIAPAQADASASRRVTWKLAAGGLALAVLLGAGLLAVYPDLKTRSKDGSSTETQKSIAPAGGEKIVSLAIGGNKEALSVGDRVQFVLTVERENGRRDEMTERAHWSSSNPAVLETAGGGEFVAKDPGTVDVVAEYEGMPAPPVQLIIHASPQSVPAKKVELVSLAIEPANAAIEVNERLALRITGKYSDGKEQQLKGARWESSDRTVVAVNAAGELAARRTGTAQISASYRGLKSEPVLVSVMPPQTKPTPMARKGSVGADARVSAPGKESEAQIVTKGSPPPDPSKPAKSDARPGYAELKEPPIKKPTPPPETSIKEHIKSARLYRDRGDYAAAFVELEKARRIDGTNQEVQAEIAVTTRACNAERSLVRPDLKCGG